MKVFKYQLSPLFVATGNHFVANLELPTKAWILTAAYQGQILTIWAAVNEGEKLRSRTFRIYPTGVETGDRVLSHINTVFLEGLVFHLFEDLSL